MERSIQWRDYTVGLMGRLISAIVSAVIIGGLLKLTLVHLYDDSLFKTL